MSTKFSQFDVGGDPVAGDILVGLRSGLNTQFTFSGAEGSALNTASTITQAAHGFTAGQVLRLNGATYVLAQADTAVDAEVVGIVGSVIDVNDFVLITGGQFPISGLTVGLVYWLDPAVPGGLTSTEPTTPGLIEKPIVIANSSTTGIFYNERGRVIPFPSTAFIWNTVTTNQTAAPNNGYMCNSSSLITITLPSTFDQDGYITVGNCSTGNFQIAQQAGQSINVYNVSTTVGTSGYLQSTEQGCSVTIMCFVANATFVVVGSQGVITYN